MDSFIYKWGGSMTQYTKEVDEQRQRLKFEEKDDTLVYYYWQADGDLRKYKYESGKVIETVNNVVKSVTYEEEV